MIDCDIADKTPKLIIVKRNMKFLDLCFHLCGYLARSKRYESEFIDKFNDFDSQFKDFALGKENFKPPLQLNMLCIPLGREAHLIVEKYKDFFQFLLD